MKKCIIVSAGEFVPIEIEKEADDLIIAADGGYEYCLQVGLIPDLVIGDFDSVTDSIRDEIMQLKEREPERVIQYPREKDDTDTMAAIRIGLERGYELFQLYAAAGGRIDHMIANIQCLQYIKNHHAKGYIMNHNMMMTVIKNEKISFHKGMKGILSVLSLDHISEGVSIQNMKYQIKNKNLSSEYPVGISNEFTEKEGTVSVEKGSLLLIVYWEE